MDPRELVGSEAGPYEEHLSVERMAEFARSVSAAMPGIPPTWLTLCRKGEFELLTRAGFRLDQVLHGEQEYRYLEGYAAFEDALSSKSKDELCVGYRTRLAEVTSKAGGGLLFLVFETEVSVLAPIAMARTTIVIRQKAAES